MIPLYEDPCFTFRFNEARIIPRFHLEGPPTGTVVAIYKRDPDSGARAELITHATVGEDGWVGLTEPLIVEGGGGFFVVPTSNPNVSSDSASDA